MIIGDDKKYILEKIKKYQDIKKTLSRMKTRLSLLTKEVTEIKQLLKKDKKTQAVSEAKEISLDFESWLKKDIL